MSTSRPRGQVVPIMALALAAASANAQVPNDPDWPFQWGLHNTGQIVEGHEGVIGADVDALAAWDLHQGTSSVLVAIVGSGIDPHQEFADRLLPGIATAGDPFNTRDTCPQDTHLAGIIAAATNNGIGVAGLNGSARILPVRVLDNCYGTEATAAQGITWAVDHGAHVILVPLQFYAGTPSFESAVAYAVSSDVVIVAPAGNGGNAQVAFPAAYEGCLAVSATTAQDTLSPYSNYGADVDLAAPGSYIWSTWIGDGYHYLEPPGDAAAAAAFVAGVASLVRSYAPQLSAAEVREILIASAEDIGESDWDVSFGSGRVNARRALETAPAPALRFEQVEDFPTLVRPEQVTSFYVRIVDVAESVVNESAALYYRADSSTFVRTALTPVGGDIFEAHIPAVPCGSILEYYLLALGDGGTTVADPLDATATLHHAEAVIWLERFADDFEEDLSWEIEGGDNTNGRWSRVIPIGTSAQPGYDFSPDAGSYCYVTGQHFGGGAGSNDVDGGPVRLLSPLIELSTPDAEVSYARWFHCSGTGEDDFLTVEMSRDNGSTWTTVESVASTDAWIPIRFRLSDFPEAVGSQLRVRFSTSDSPNDSLTEAAIDEFRVGEVHCSFVGGDGNGDGVVDLADFGDLFDCLTGPDDIILPEDCLAFDFEPDDDVDLRDLHAFQRAFEPQ